MTSDDDVSELLKPTLDENGMPWCSGYECPLFKRAPESDWGRCEHANSRMDRPNVYSLHPGSMCYPRLLELVRKGQDHRVSTPPEGRFASSALMAELINRALGTDLGPYDFSVSDWDCPDSPLEVCVYPENPPHDSCLFCGNPGERK